MVDDHSKANDELMQLATTKGMAVPKEMKKIHRDMIDKLSKSSGAAFDKAYVDEMVKDHVKDVSAFRKEAKEGKDPEVKAWASKTLPTLEDHLKMVRDLSKKEMGKKEPAKKK
jgi:putative membrane protein